MRGIEPFLNTVVLDYALTLLGVLPTASIAAVIADAMHGTNCRYDWGLDPARGDPVKHWQIHQAIYEECLRVLRPGGILAWGQGFEFIPHFDNWFGPHRVWSPICRTHGLNFNPNVWVVQTRERQPVEHPNNMIVPVDRNLLVPLKKLHPCPKPVEEMRFLIDALTKPGEIILDCFCGLGSTLVAARQLGRPWIGCDKSRRYCQVAMKRLADLDVPGPHRGPLPGSLFAGNGRSDPRAATGPKDGTATPQLLFDRLEEGVIQLTGRGFELDAAAEGWNAKCPHYFDAETDALKQDWSAWRTVFCNPPFSAELISKFVAKALEAGDKGSTVVLLLPSWPGYPWFQELKRRGQMQDVIGPVAFERADGTKIVMNKGKNTTSLVVATLGPRVVAGTNGEPISKSGVLQGGAGRVAPAARSVQAGHRA
jgi:site-specific DNA-methyltransferase (adenine-specific)